MGTTQPIRDKDELKNFIAYYEVAHPNIRNYTMIILGLYTALRISDVLNLKWNDVYYFEKDCFLDHLLIHEQKTGKVNEIALNSHVIKALDCYRKTRKPDAEDYIFQNPPHLRIRSAVPRHIVLCAEQRTKPYAKRMSAVIRSARRLAIMHGNREFRRFF